MTEPKYIDKGATFSPCKQYRYTLWRTWKETDRKPVLFVMLNPSTADENILDPTVTRCLGYAMKWGYGKMIVCNIFAYRSTDPKALYKVKDPVGPDNDKAIQDMARDADMVIGAWGTHGLHYGRSRKVERLITGITDLYSLKLTKDGVPGHPLYLKSDIIPTIYKKKEVTESA